MSPLELRGTCRVLHCLAVASAIDLEAAEPRLRDAHRTRFHHKAPGFASGGARPIRMTWPADPVRVAGAESTGEAEVAVYPSGALAITRSVPFAGPPQDLVRLSAELYENAPLLDAARALARGVVADLGPACGQPGDGALVEDYVVFEIAAVAGGAPGALAREQPEAVARILRAEEGALSSQEVEDALSRPVSYGPDDLALVDWLGAVLVGEQTLDERLVLELVNVELLGVRLLDARLDEEVEAAYALLGRPDGALRSLLFHDRELGVVARMKADAAVLHERVDNPLKLLGDDYLARLYRVATTRFHLPEWDESIQRRLGVLGDVHTSLAERATSRRSALLEWIIILLIAIDIVLYFTPLR